MTFEETLNQLQAWLNEPVAVNIFAPSPPPFQVALLVGRLRYADTLPEAIQTLSPALHDSLIFYVGREDDLNNFTLSRAMFQSASMEATNLGKAMLRIVVAGTHLLVTLRPERAE